MNIDDDDDGGGGTDANDVVAEDVVSAVDIEGIDFRINIAVASTIRTIR